jgi:hypothetical protein
MGIESAEGVNETVMRRFTGEEQPHQGILAAIAMRHLVNHLRDQGIVW